MSTGTLTYDTVIVPLDGSHVAAEALPHATQVARACGARLVLVHVLPPRDDTAATFREKQAQRIQTEAYFAGLKRSLERYGLHVAWLIEEGPVAETIAAIARHAERPLIVMARRGMTAVLKAEAQVAAGSVAEEVTSLWEGPISFVEPVV